MAASPSSATVPGTQQALNEWLSILKWMEELLTSKPIIMQKVLGFV